MTAKTSSWITLAHLLRPQGRKGELLAELFTDFPERFKERKDVFLAPPQSESETVRAAEIVSFWLPMGRNQGRIVLQFAGIDSITQAEGLAGLEVIVRNEERMPLADESVYVTDLVGCTLYDGAVAVGVIADVQFPATPDGTRRLEEAAPLLEVSSADGDDILVPFAKAFMVRVDTVAKRVDMALPAGLLEVNRSSKPARAAETDEKAKL